MYAKRKTPAVTAQIIDKSDRKYHVIKTIGSSSDTYSVDELYLQGKKWISNHLGEQDIFGQAFKEADERQINDFLLSTI